MIITGTIMIIIIISRVTRRVSQVLSSTDRLRVRRARTGVAAAWIMPVYLAAAVPSGEAQARDRGGNLSAAASVTCSVAMACLH